MQSRMTLSFALLTTLLAGAVTASAQFPGQAQPQHFAWSDSTLSPDARADMVLKEMTLDEKMLLVHGQGMPFGQRSNKPTESNGGAGFTPSISRLGIPAIQMADS